MKAQKIRGGVGARVRTIGREVIISSTGGGASLFQHPWKPSLSKETLGITPGTINSIEPTIKDETLGEVPMGGKEPKKGETRKIPKLKLDPDGFDVAGKAWVCVEVTFGKLWEVVSAKMVQVAQITSENGKSSASADTNTLAAARWPSLPGRKTRYPVILLRKNLEKGTITAFEIAYFHLQVIARPTGDLASSGKATIYIFPQ